MLIDASLLKQNKFDPEYDLLGDLDLWVRLSLTTPFLCVDGVVGLYRQHHESTTHRLKNSWLKERRYFYRKLLGQLSIVKYPEIILYIAKTELKGVLNII